MKYDYKDNKTIVYDVYLADKLIDIIKEHGHKVKIIEL